MEANYLISNVTDIYPENLWDDKIFEKWISQKFHWSWIAACAYMAGIYLGTRAMETRTRFELRRPLVVWNLLLAVFSVVGFTRFLHGTLWTIERYGVHGFLCKNLDASEVNYGQMWSSLFALSKMVELGDTVFIILRKQKLIFLHWYHHTTVLVFVWHSYSEYSAIGKAFLLFNYGVHAAMYSYYTLTALKVRVPITIKKCITTIQCSQMVYGCALTIYALWLKWQGIQCRQSNENIVFAVLIYGSYLFLFCRFYYFAYLAPKTSSAQSHSVVASNGSSNGVTVKPSGLGSSGFMNGHRNGHSKTVDNGASVGPRARNGLHGQERLQAEHRKLE